MLRDIWVIMLISGIGCMILSLLLFFLWGVPDLIDDLSGRKAKRQIKLMRDINSTTGALDKFSTNELYMGISNSSSLAGELSNIKVSPVLGEDLALDEDKIETSYMGYGSSEEVIVESVYEDEEEVVTADLNSKEKTSYLDDSGDESTSFMGDSEVDIGNSNSIKILEELSSLN